MASSYVNASNCFSVNIYKDIFLCMLHLACPPAIISLLEQLRQAIRYQTAGPVHHKKQEIAASNKAVTQQLFRRQN